MEAIFNAVCESVAACAAYVGEVIREVDAIDGPGEAAECAREWRWWLLNGGCEFEVFGNGLATEWEPF